MVKCGTSCMYRTLGIIAINKYAGLLVLHLLLLSNPWLIVEMWSVQVFHMYYFGIYSSELA